MKASQNPKYKVFVFEGGSRSSKTYSIIQFLIIYALKHRDQSNRIIIARKKGTWLNATVWNDFKAILLDIGLLGMISKNETLKTVRLLTTTFEFVGLDDTQRLHGLTSDIVWVNEAMECIKDDFDNLEQRCARFMILDYNPTAEEHWIYDNVCLRKDCYFDHSTMLDNPMIPENMRRKILSYEPTEENYEQGTVDIRKWKIYGLGMRAKIEGLVFPEYHIVKEIPIWAKERYYCLDFGYTNDPTACAEVAFLNNDIYIDEKFYNTHMMTGDIIRELKKLPARKIICECADPRLVDEIAAAGLLIFAVQKYAGSVEAGISYMQEHRLNITENSPNAKKELDNYTYMQDKNGKWLNIPVDDYNHIIDGTRYVCLNEKLGQVPGITNLTGVFHSRH
jgi:phage terminase large subunit